MEHNEVKEKGKEVDGEVKKEKKPKKEEPPLIHVSEHWKKEKAMTLEQRRARYKCKENFVTLDKIPTWPEYAQEHHLEHNTSHVSDNNNNTTVLVPMEQKRENANGTEKPDEAKKIEKQNVKKEEHSEKNEQRTENREEHKDRQDANEHVEETKHNGTEKQKEKSIGTNNNNNNNNNEVEEIERKDHNNEQEQGIDFEKDKTLFQFQGPPQKKKELEIKKQMRPLDEVIIPKDVKVRYYSKANCKVSIWQGDKIDAIVNAANERCLGGGGVDGAIHNAAGDMLFEECRTLRGCPEGKAKITRGYNLPAKYVIHTVGPHGEDEIILRKAYKSSLALVKKYNIKTVAFCGISTGIFGYPLYLASAVACSVVRKWLDSNHSKVKRIIFCTFLPKETQCYERLLPVYFPLEGEDPKGCF